VRAISCAVHRGPDELVCAAVASEVLEEDADAIDTLHTVLEVTGRLAAPLLPLISEVIWRGVTGERSVHLTDWPEPDVCPGCGTGRGDGSVRAVASAASSLRKAKKLRCGYPCRN